MAQREIDDQLECEIHAAELRLIEADFYCDHTPYCDCNLCTAECMAECMDTITVSLEQYQKFVDILNNPPPPTPALIELMNPRLLKYEETLADVESGVVSYHVLEAWEDRDPEAGSQGGRG